MNKLLNRQLDELLTNSRIPSTNLRCESALRVGAATIGRATTSEIAATTVVCDLQDADLDTFESLVQEIADEYCLEASIQQQQQHCAYSVRFTWPLPSVSARDVQAEKSLLARLSGIWRD